MITKPPYQFDWQTFVDVPYADRWVYDKLRIAEVFGYACGPVGVDVPPGTYCIRPIYNVKGMASDGFYKVEHPGGVLEGKGGYCWTEWSDEPRQWIECVNDVSVKHVQLAAKTPERETYRPGLGLAMPDELKGISRYMIVEYLGDRVIDVGLRLDPSSVNQTAVDDYRTIDPTYIVPDHIDNQPISADLVARMLPDGGQTWFYEFEEA